MCNMEMDYERELSEKLKGWLRMERDSSSDDIDNISERNPLFVYIKLPCDLQPMERGELFEDPIQKALDGEKVGAITGGGSLLSAPDSDGNRSIEYCGIDVDLYDGAKGLVLLRRELIRLQAPEGTALLYELDGHEYEEPIYRAKV